MMLITGAIIIKRYDDFIDFRTTVFDRPTEPSFYLPKGKFYYKTYYY